MMIYGDLGRPYTPQSKTKECAVNDSNIVTQVSIQLAIDIITLVLPTMKKRPYWQHR